MGARLLSGEEVCLVRSGVATYRHSREARVWLPGAGVGLVRGARLARSAGAGAGAG
ncbi:hypothetical protein Pen01_13470 [Phytomonospora endophytica]|nr:hypothetical protein Pen01_13470 [Phytomonospora endophytica]